MQTRSAKKSQRSAATAKKPDLASAANLGPKSAEVLARVGITTLSDLKQVGSIRAYYLAKKADPSVSLNLLWAIEGAIVEQHWQVVAREHRTSLLLALEDYVRESANL